MAVQMVVDKDIIKLTFDGFVSVPEMQAWIEDSKKVISKLPKGFGVLAKMQDMKPLSIASGDLLAQGQKMYAQSGMGRSCVVFRWAIQSLQAAQTAATSGIMNTERYLSTERYPDWELTALNWIAAGVEPTKR